MTDERKDRPTMLSLISEQAIPNVMAALLVEPRPRQMICLLPEDREHKGQIDQEFNHVFNGIRDALARIDPTIRVINWAASGGGGHPISPYDADQVRQACHAIRQDRRFAGALWVYNITGGTKVMAQAALDDARTAYADGCCKALYVDTDSRRLIWDGAGSCDFDEDRLRKVGVAEYLAAYGVQVKRYDDVLDDDLRLAARQLGQSREGPSVAAKIAGRENPGQDQEVRRCFGQGDPRLSHGERALLAEIACTLSGRDIKVQAKGKVVDLSLWTTDEALRGFFWGGRWLESYVFDTVCRLSEQDDAWRFNPPWRNVLLEWSGIEYSGLVDRDEPMNALARPANELDVAASRGARLLICECKTGANALDPKHLYKLHVIGHKSGTFADKVLVTDQPDLLDPQNSAARHRVVRALTSNIVVIPVSHLPILDEILVDPEKELRQQKRLFKLAA
jgi:hypothetical protein